MRRPRSRFTSPLFILGTIVLMLTGSRSPEGLAGPATSSAGLADTTKVYGYICKKAPDSSCLSDTSKMFSIADIQMVTVIFRLKNRTVTDSFVPQRVEALFFTMSAANRMLIPYYKRTRGGLYADSTHHRLSACEARAPGCRP